VGKVATEFVYGDSDGRRFPEITSRFGDGSLVIAVIATRSSNHLRFRELQQTKEIDRRNE
jgi:hypothetical protein